MRSIRVALALVTAGCSGPAQTPHDASDGDVTRVLECDPARAGELVFGYQDLALAERTGYEAVMLENGAELLFIDGSCRYWAYHQTDSELRWSGVRTGVLEGDALESVSAELLGADWDAIDGVVVPPSVSDADARSVWQGDRVGTCFSLCDDRAPAPLREVVRAAERWTRTLHAAGADLDTGPMRVTVAAYEGPDDAFPFSDWTGPTPLDALVAPGGYGTYGDHRIVDGDDAARLRELRARYRSRELDSFSYQFLPLESEGSLYSVWARDVLPMEDGEGLVRP